MAFVFRSERNMMKSLLPQSDNNCDNDNYYKYSNISSPIKTNENLLKDKSKQSSKKYSPLESPSPPFLSNTERNKQKKIEDSPGPGTYNISKGYYDKHRQFSSRQENSIPEEYDYYNLPLLRMKEVINENPGPGQYNPSEKDLFGGKFGNKNKIFPIFRNNNVSENGSQSVSNIFKRRKSSEKENSYDIDKNMDKLIYIYSPQKKVNNEEKRINKVNNMSKKKLDDYGEVEGNISMKNIRGPLSSLSNESDNNNIILNNMGLSNNNNNSKISGITPDTERTSINTSKLSHSQVRNKSSKLLQKLSYQLKNNQNNLYNNIISSTEQNINKSKTLLPVSLKYDKSRIYKNDHSIRRLLYKDENELNNFNDNVNEFDKLLNSEYFSQNPGPGYYDPIYLPDQKYYKPKKNINYFNNFKGENISSLMKTNKMATTTISPGPGEYRTTHNNIQSKIRNSMDKKMKDILYDVKKLSKLRIIREKEVLERNKDIQLLKEKNVTQPKYDNNSKEVFEKENLGYRNFHTPKNLLFNFGSNDKRFKELIKPNYPGPGKYETNLYKSIEGKNENISKSLNFQELYNRLENKNIFSERFPLNKESLNNPPVGTYNPDIVSSIKYNYEYKNLIKPPIIHRSSFNPNLEKKTLKNVQEIKEKEKKIISLLGPGKYYNMLNNEFEDLNKNEENNKPPFGSSEKKLGTKKMDQFPGPGQYEVNSYYNWITRTYNILFS